LTATTKPRNANWIWLFAVLAVLSGLAVGINLMFNLRQQLTPEELTRQRQRWEAAGPASYDLVIKKVISAARSDGTPVRDELRVQVRGRQAVGGTLNGRPLESRLWAEYDMPGWFDFVERFLEKDRQPGAPRAFCVARFDATDGHLVSFVRSVGATRERQELKFELAAVQ